MEADNPAVWKFPRIVIVRSVIKPSAYFDSVTLMLAQKEVRQMPGVEEAGAVMESKDRKSVV